MRKVHDKLIFSPSDLIVFLDSPFASWMDRFRLERPADCPPPDDDDGSIKLLQDKGNEHEALYLRSLQTAGRDVFDVTSKDAYEETVDALRAGREVIYQGALKRDDFAGRSDFLLRVNGNSQLGSYHYEVWDTKLSRKAKPYFLIQLCCYAEMLEPILGMLPEHVGIILGDGSKKRFRTQDYYFYYRELKQAFISLQNQFDVSTKPLPMPMEDCRHWTSYADKIREEMDALGRIANIRRTQIQKLEKAGITTTRALAECTTARIPKMEQSTFQCLQQQAQLQIESAGLKTPKYAVLPHAPEMRRGLGLLPPRSPLDVFFDMEGYPHVDGGLEYLFGASYYRDGQEERLEFADFWAHDRTTEKLAFEQFVDWVFDRWQRDKTMHIYHYADYEVSAVRRLMGRHATREEQVDELLRNEVFVNLYTVVKQGLRVGVPSYSIKKIELLYRPKRATDVSTAMDSVVLYQDWIENSDGLTWNESKKLKSIRDYNQDDCDSTAQLATWLRNVQRETGIAYVLPVKRKAESDTGENEASAAKLSAKRQANQQLCASILRSLPDDREQRPVNELLAHLLDFHWRAAKPLFWALYDRHAMTEIELIDDADCLGALEKTSKPPEKMKQSFLYEYRFDPDQETKLCAGKRCFYAHDLNERITIESFDSSQGLLTFKLGVKREAPPAVLSLIPDEYISAGKIEESIRAIVERWHAGGGLPSALEDFLFRRRPRIKGSPAGPILDPLATDFITAATEAVRAMESTTLCIQGPPGTGKTTTGAQIIVRLLGQGKRIAVSSNSHRAISNLLEEVGKAARKLEVSISAAKIQNDTEDFGLEAQGMAACKNIAEALAGGYQLVGGTAWAFSDESAVDAFDYLIVDEAGQVSVANLVGMSPCAKNIIVMGDQMQLGQPIQGSHPGESGQSILEYLLQDQQTIPDEFGIFLGTSYRMHPDVCQFVSQAFYEGRLHSAEETRARWIVTSATTKFITKAAGILHIPVVHEGNTQASDEEATMIADVIKDLLTCEVMDNGISRPLSPEDILIVAPYNMQVRNLQRIHSADLVGTVDKFQGQQKSVVIVSMCASDGNESARGLDFLFSKNRLNVAISRAKCLAIVVSSPSLCKTSVSKVEHVALINTLCRIAQEGTSTANVLAVS